jgi:hypothetical protein
MSRPIGGDGTITYSTGRPGWENAPAAALAGEVDKTRQQPRHGDRNGKPPHPEMAARLTKLFTNFN